MANAEFLRKITIRNCGWASDAILKAVTVIAADGKSVEFNGTAALLRVWGRSTDAKPGQTDTGAYVRLVGDFHALNLVTWERFKSGAIILPNFISEPMAGALRESPAIEFALEIGAKGDPTSATKYVFSVREVKQAEPADSLKRLELEALAGLPAPAALPAPAPAAADPAPAPAAAPAAPAPARSRRG